LTVPVVGSGVRRRRLLAALTTGVTAPLAGCSLPGDGGESAGTTTGTPTDAAGTGTATPVPVAEAFELTRLQATESQRLNEPWGFAFSVRNRTGTDRPFRSTISTRRGDESEWEPLGPPIEFGVPAGEVRTWKSPAGRFRYLVTVEYRLDALGTTWTVEVLPLTLMYGQTYTSPVGLRTTVESVRFEATRPTDAATDEGGANATATPATTPTPTPTATTPDGETRWALARITVENPTDRERPAPFPQELTLGREDREDGPSYEPRALDLSDLYLRERALAPGERHGGVLPYEVPADLAANDAEIVLSRSYDDGEVEVRWSS
jgi:hypothetical protein